MKRYYITIKGGNVQRCGFRKVAAEKARQLKLTGLAYYLDHHIAIEVEGDMTILESYLSWCKAGPLGCMIETVEFVEIPVKGSTSFEIIHGVVMKEAPPSRQA
jgi:acylphosphatase